MANGTKKVEKQVSLETALWNCRVALRGVGTLEKNRDAVITLVFLKFAGDKFEKRRKQLIDQYGNNPIFLEKVSFYNADNVFYVSEEARWSYIVKNASRDDIAVVLDNALKILEETNPPLKNILQKNLFVSLSADKSKLKSLIDAVNDIDEKKYQEQDLIGRTYEYFLRLYAASASKEDGEFYTPACIVKLIAEMIEPYEGIVYDPCCGSGGMFVQSMKFVESHNGNKNQVSIVGQESVPETWRLCKMNLAIRGISHNLGLTHASTFINDQHKDKKVDYIMANPPFNLKKYWSENLKHDSRWAYGLPREANANYAWIMHMISKLDVNHGIAGFLLANGALGDADDAVNREAIIRADKVEAIIVLPRDMFYTTDISVTLWILNMNKNAGVVHGRKLRDRQHEILFMDLRTWDDNVSEVVIDKGKTKKKTCLTDEQIAKAKEIYNNWQSADTTLYQDVPELCKSVKIFNDDLTEDEKNKKVVTVESQGFVLMPSKYIEFIDHDLDIDYQTEMIRIQQQMTTILQEEKKSQQMLAEAFRGIGYGIDEN